MPSHRQPSGPVELKSRDHVWLRWVAAVLAAASIGFVAYGTWSAWTRRSDIDTQAREDEYVLFRMGVYPNAHIETPPPWSGRVYTVYPPYTLPMFAVFFEPGGALQARILIQALSLASLVVMGAFAYRTLAPQGESVALLGAVAGAAMAGNATALMVGQFSIICVGLIVLQMLCLERQRPLAAGACWALAMIKPQIALPFGVLFMFRGQFVGGLFGAAILGVLSLAACAWTEVSFLRILRHWLGEMSFEFATRENGFGPGRLASVLGIDPRVAQLITLGVLAAVMVPVGWFMRRLDRRALVPVAGLCSVAGMFFAYHRFYDNVMLFPALLALIALAAESGRLFPMVVVGAMIARLLLPQRIFDYVPWHGVLQSGLWVAAGILPLRMAVGPAAGLQDSRAVAGRDPATADDSIQSANRA